MLIDAAEVALVATILEDVVLSEIGALLERPAAEFEISICVRGSSARKARGAAKPKIPPRSSPSTCSSVKRRAPAPSSLALSIDDYEHKM